MVIQIIIILLLYTSSSQPLKFTHSIVSILKLQMTAFVTGLLHFWMIQEHKRLINNNSVNHDVDSIGYMGPENSLSVEYVKKFGNAGINDLLENVMTFEGGVNVNIEAAIRDLEEFNLIEYHPGSSSFPDGKWIKRIIEGKEAEEKLKERWIDLF